MKEISLSITSLYVIMIGIWWMLMLYAECLGKFRNHLTFLLYKVLFAMTSISYCYYIIRHPAAIRRTQGSAFGKVSNDFGISHVNCTGSENSLLDCPHEDGKGCRSCKAAGVVCEPGMTGFMSKI